MSEFHSDQIQGDVEYIEDPFNPPESDRVLICAPATMSQSMHNAAIRWPYLHRVQRMNAIEGPQLVI